MGRRYDGVLGLAFGRQLLEQSLCQCQVRCRPSLSALAASSRGDGEYLSCHPVSAPVCLAIDFAGDRVT